MVEDNKKEEIPSVIIPSVQIVLMREGENGPEVFLGHRIAGGFLDQWSFPGGKIDEGESDKRAGVRELEEETGVTVSEDDLSYLRDTQSSTIREKAGKRTRYDYRIKVYSVNAQDLSPRNASPDEHSEMVWMSLTDALAMHDRAASSDQATGVMRSPDKIPGALAPKTLETIRFLAARRTKKYN